MRKHVAIVSEMPRRLAGQSNFGIRYEDLPIFQQPWWLDIAKGDARSCELSIRWNDVVVGSISFIVVANKIGNKLGFPPIWSHLGGPVVSQALEPEEKAEAIRQLIGHLPPRTSFKFVCSSAVEDAELIRTEFARAGFERSAETTYLEYPDDPGMLERITRKSRQQITSAAEALEVVDIGADEFISFYAANLATAKKQSYASLESAQDLIVKGQQGGGGPKTRVIGARRREPGAPLDAAIAYAWDDRRYYLWLMTYRLTASDVIQKAHQHAGKLLILRGTEDARERGLIFDADGATTGGSETLYRDRLRFPHSELRDVFTRDTGLYKLYKRFRSYSRAKRVMS